MNVRTLAWLTASLVCTSAAAAPGETAGAYGGGTSTDAPEVSMESADQDGNGVVDPSEARRAGIERFEVADKNQDGVLDRQELSLTRTSGQMVSGDVKGELTTKSNDAELTTAGEQAGAYGGGTPTGAYPVNLEAADDNGDGVVNRQEARRVGIEQFDEADKNQDGVLDEAELAALETATQAGGNTESGSGAAAPDGATAPEAKP